MLGLITGSGFYNLDAMTDAEVVKVDTPYGAVSLTKACWHGATEMLFLPRHGSNHSVPPHAINYQANIWALRESGATGVIATAVSGGMADGLEPGHFVVIDDFIDFTQGRKSTFFEAPGNLVHSAMENPYDDDLRNLLIDAAQSAGVPLTKRGTYCATNGPRFETKAEIAMMRQAGGDLVGMTGCPEVVLANELELPYASIGVISNRAAGLSDREFTVPEIMNVLAEAAPPLELMLSAVIEGYAS